jgi:hypothetical protein
MKKLFYRLSSSRSFAKLFSNRMHERLEERRKVMFSKSSVFAVVALAAFVSLGALLFTQVAQACLWGCDLGSDENNPSGENSPGFSIIYCFDQLCVANLKDSDGNLIFPKGTAPIPTAFVEQVPTPDVPNQNSCPTLTPPDFMTISITGTVVAILRDSDGIIHPESAAEAEFKVGVKKVLCSVPSTSTSSILSRVVGLNESPGNVFDVNSSINILKTPALNLNNTSLSNPIGWNAAGCPTNSDGTLADVDCSFPFGIVQFKNSNALEKVLPDTGDLVTDFLPGEVYRGVGSVHFVGVRMCKGDANGSASTVGCSAGGFVADAVFPFPGQWASAGPGEKKFNPTSATAPFFISTTLNVIDNTVTGSANGGPQVATDGCRPVKGQAVVSCDFPARDFRVVCNTGDTVEITVRGRVDVGGRRVQFVSEADTTCNNTN